MNDAVSLTVQMIERRDDMCRLFGDRYARKIAGARAVLAAAMGSPRDYYFHGTREQRVKQIGNAVHVDQAEALCMAVMKGGQ